MLIKDGISVRECFARDFNSEVCTNTVRSEFVRYELNVQDGINTSVSCICARASEYIVFRENVTSEIQKHGIALVLVSDYSNGPVSEYLCLVVED